MLKKDILIDEDITIKESLKKLDITAEKVLLVVDKKNHLIGALTDGDIRRYILKTGNLDNTIKDIYNKNPIFIEESKFSIIYAKKIFIQKKIQLIPIINKKKEILNFITWNEVFPEDEYEYNKTEPINIPVVIMAGGKGTRLDPFTRVFPKPLIPIGNKTILELIIEEFKKYSISEFYISLNYKGKMIEAYLNDIKKDYIIKYIWEKNFLGTAGSLKLIDNNIHNTFIVTNCDIIVKANYHKVVKFHEENEAFLTILSSIQHYKIPYGVIQYKNGGGVTRIIEKPEHTFTINTGIYLLNKKCIEFIPHNHYFDMTDLINVLLKEKKKILIYPVNQNDYIDMGQWEEYKMAVEKLNSLSYKERSM